MLQGPQYHANAQHLWLGQRSSESRPRWDLWSWLHPLPALRRLGRFSGLGSWWAGHPVLDGHGAERHWTLRLPAAPGPDHSHGRGDVGIPQVGRKTNHQRICSSSLKSIHESCINRLNKADCSNVKIKDIKTCSIVFPYNNFWRSLIVGLRLPSQVG